MPLIDIVVECDVSRSTRARQLEAIFDVPPIEKSRVTLQGEMPIEDRPWNIGLIVGPSGCGKSTILRNAFGDPRPLDWNGKSVIDDFSSEFGIEPISSVCQAVGFNTIPAWLRPYAVLSNGEKFRVEMARRLLESEGTIVIDEFTSVVDRQVAQIGSHAVQKHVRKTGKQFVAASCHYDIIDWLQPDWILEPATMTFQWRSLQRRPALDVEIRRVPYETWKIFAPYHYMSADLNRSARCFGLFVGGRLATFVAVLYRPHPKVRNLYGLSRGVTLPDFQGLGLIFVLIDNLSACYKALGFRMHGYAAHPALTRSYDRSPNWQMEKAPGNYSPRVGKNSRVAGFGGRACAVFSYAGPAHDDPKFARDLIGLGED